MADFMELTMPQDGLSLIDLIIKENLDERILVINTGIDESIIENAVLYILKWNREDKDLPEDKRKPIRIYFNSQGGSVLDGQALIDAILCSKTKVVGIAMGLVASEAYQIYLACDDRIAFANAIFLQHDGETTIQNSSSKAKQTMNFFDSMEKRVKDYVLSRTKMSEEFYDKIYDQEYWMYANDKGLELGIAQRIIGVDCDLDEIL